MDTYLMLGGPLDGRLYTVEESRDTFLVPEFQGMADLVAHEGAEPPKFETTLYKRELLRSGLSGREYHVLNAQDRVPPLFRLLKGCARSPYHLKHDRTLFIGGPLEGESLRTFVTSANIEGQWYYRQDLKEGYTCFYIYTTTAYSDPIRELLDKYGEVHGKNRR